MLVASPRLRIKWAPTRLAVAVKAHAHWLVRCGEQVIVCHGEQDVKTVIADLTLEGVMRNNEDPVIRIEALNIDFRS
jgi:hypothetical protein